MVSDNSSQEQSALPPVSTGVLRIKQIRISNQQALKASVPDAPTPPREDQASLLYHQFVRAGRTFNTRIDHLRQYIDGIEQVAGRTEERNLHQCLHLLRKIAMEAEDESAAGREPIARVAVVFEVSKSATGCNAVETTFERPVYDSRTVDSIKDFAETHSVATGILYSTSLQYLANAMERLMADLLRCHFMSHPAAARKDKHITYQDLLAFDSIDDAKNHIIDLEIDDFLRLKTEDQFDRIAKHLGKEWLDSVSDIGHIVELMLRRHAVVHAGGIASREYCQRAKMLGLSEFCGVVEGSTLEVDKTYLSQGLTRIAFAGVVLTELCLKKAHKSPEATHAAEAFVNAVGFELMCDNRHSDARRVFDYAAKTRSRPEFRCMAEINLAQTIKRNCEASDEKTDAARIAALVDKAKWQTSSAIFQICAAAIREDPVEFARLLRIVAMQPEEFVPHFLAEWPVFEWIRKHPDFPAWRSSAFPEQKFIEPQKSGFKVIGAPIFSDACSLKPHWFSPPLDTVLNNS